MSDIRIQAHNENLIARRKKYEEEYAFYRDQLCLAWGYPNYPWIAGYFIDKINELWYEEKADIAALHLAFSRNMRAE
jgi:hypothetical protein